jgi:hypothetical protein
MSEEEKKRLEEVENNPQLKMGMKFMKSGEMSFFVIDMTASHDWVKSIFFPSLVGYERGF